MREIKFRIWDKTNKTMYDKVLIGDYPETVPMVWTEYEGEKDWYHIESSVCEVMQYTGMADYNFTDIYVGDIVEFTRNDITVIGYIVFELGGFAVVFNADDMYRIYQDTWNYNIKLLGELYLEQEDYIECNVIDNLKIIGNIYENPEILGEW